MDIFNSSPGAVYVMDTGATVLGAIYISTPQFPAGGGAVLISGVRYTQRTCHQFQPALDRKVYVYVFGDNMGAIEVRGLALPGTCEGGGGPGPVLQYYDTNRASMKTTPIIVTVGEELISGFLTGLDMHSVTAADEGTAHTLEFSLTISALPKEAA